MFFAAPLLLAGTASPLGAQVVRGTVVDPATEQPVDEATVVLVDSLGEERVITVTDTAGAFRLVAPEPGRYRLRAERLGYADALSEPVEVGPDDVVTVELRLSTDPIPVAPLAVTARRDARLERVRYYERRELYGEKLGSAHFLDPDDIERKIAFRVSDLLRDVPGVRVVAAGGRRVVIRTRRFGYGCNPTVWVDGVEFSDGDRIDGLISPSAIVAVEVYTGTAAPAQYVACGAIVLWTGYRADGSGSRPRTTSGVPISPPRLSDRPTPPAGPGRPPSAVGARNTPSDTRPSDAWIEHASRAPTMAQRAPGRQSATHTDALPTII